MTFAHRIRFMLADDQKLFAESVVALLSHRWSNAVIDTAADYSSLFRQLEENAPYDLIIFDLRMPKGSSDPSVEMVRRAAPSAILILISGSADAFEVGKAFSTGIDAFVHKNQRADDLVETIERFLGDRSIEQTSTTERSDEGITGVTLSRRERQTLRLIATGLETKEIAQELKIAPTTVKVYIKSLLKKTGCANRTGLAVLAIQSGILNQPIV